MNAKTPQPSLNLTDARVKFFLSLVGVVGVVFTASQFITDKVNRLQRVETDVAKHATAHSGHIGQLGDDYETLEREVRRLQEELRDLQRDLQIHRVRHEQSERSGGGSHPR